MASKLDLSRWNGPAVILASTAVAGVAGYVVMLVAPAVMAVGDYADFTVYWSTVYLITASLLAIQNEVSRAARERLAGQAGSRRSVLRFTVIAGALVALLGAGVAIALGPTLFGSEWSLFVAPILVGAGGYVVLAVVMGMLFGVRRWAWGAAIGAGDAVLRLIGVVPAMALGAPAVVIAWLVVIPFSLVPIGIWLLARRRIGGVIAFDVDYRGLARNILITLPGAAAAALLVTGLPVLIRAAGGTDALAVAPLFLAITLGRAPVVMVATSLQGYLIVRMRDGEHGLRRLAAVIAAGVGAVLVIAVVAGLIGPWLIEVLLHPGFAVDGVTIGVVVASGGLVGAMFAVAAALIARGRHGWQSAGWIVAAVVTAGALAMGEWWPLSERTLVALVAGPVVGLGVFAIGLARPRRVPS